MRNRPVERRLHAPDRLEVAAGVLDESPVDIEEERAEGAGVCFPGLEGAPIFVVVHRDGREFRMGSGDSTSRRQ